MASCARCGQTIADPYGRCASCGHDIAARAGDDDAFVLSVPDETLDAPSGELWPEPSADEAFAMPRTEETLVHSAPGATPADPLRDPFETPGPDGLPPEPGGEPAAGSLPPSPAHAPFQPPPAAGWNRALTLGIVGTAVAGGLAMVVVLRSHPTPPHGATPPVDVQAASVVPAVRAALPSTVRQWSRETTGRWVGNYRRSLAFELPAENTVAVWMKRVRPLLIVRCLDGATEVFVYTDSAARIEPQDDNHTVGLAFDDEPARAERWPDAAGHDALFAPDGEALARRLARAGQMRFAFTPHNAAPVEARFDLRGFDDVVDPLARACRWK